MRCSSSNGLMIPGSDYRFPTARTPDQFPRMYPTRLSFGSLKAKAKFYDTATATADADADANATAVLKESEEMSFYELLGLRESVTSLEIKQAYKQMALKYHPDVSPPDQVEEYTQRFIRVQEAYETLSDPRSRALYDRDLSMGLHLAFSARKRCPNNMDMELRGQWKDRWQSQLSDLKKRSVNKDARGNMTWAARMRKQRDKSSQEL